MSEQEKKRQRISDVLNAKIKPKIFPKSLEVIYGLHQAQALTSLITQYGVFFWKLNKCNFPSK